MAQSFRMTRLGCLAVHLMSQYHGKKLEEAVKRIAAFGPKNKREHGAVLLANNDECGDDPKLPERQ